MDASHHWVSMGDGSACSSCAICTCHDPAAANQPCAPTGFFMVPSPAPGESQETDTHWANGLPRLLRPEAFDRLSAEKAARESRGSETP